ncbi:ABC transporter ATP-binding protein [Salinicola socius]|uniref:ABC transporter ATP-binding protein n=1 Tax=Salinicola socius TaxID=404433 RepID=A0A1Q8SVZ3_9GAMM|nr:oligopeptide/dipeptide ABC transporter ATP-binding protein [Salinicola socius]OLO05502.1 ABC transporter ATP-binding protein [Salinicola socius]
MNPIDALRTLGRAADVPAPLVKVLSLRKRFALYPDRLLPWRFDKHSRAWRRQRIHAVNGVDLEIQRGDALCVVGESGCGKSTLARLIMGLLRASEGEVHYDGQRIDHLSAKQWRPFRQRMQMIFQNPYASLNPRLTVRQSLEEPIRLHHPGWSRSRIRDRADSLMADVGIDLGWSERFAHEFSGGQRQRIAIARALSVDPEFVIADEPVSALDVSVQAQILNLLMNAQAARRLTYLFITHDLAVVEHFATRVAVMYLGTICELADTDTLFAHPRHPYTQALLAASPRLEDGHVAPLRLGDEASMPIAPPSGCVFRGRCPHADARCQRENPEPLALRGDHQVACHAVEEGRI